MKTQMSILKFVERLWPVVKSELGSLLEYCVRWHSVPAVVAAFLVLVEF